MPGLQSRSKSSPLCENVRQLIAGFAANTLVPIVLILSLRGVMQLWYDWDEIHSLRAALKLANYAVLLLLNYSNASTALPQAFGNPDVDFLVFIYSTTLVLCARLMAPVGYFLDG